MNKKLLKFIEEKTYYQDIIKAIEALEKGQIILYPTDTIWGLGCDATNSEAVRKISKLKKREDGKSMLILLDNEKRLPEYVDIVPEAAFDLIKLSNKPLTIIYPNAKNVAPELLAEDGSLGIRIPEDDFLHDLLKIFAKPIVSTSANISGQKPPVNFHDITDDIKKNADYIVKWRQNDRKRAKPSSIIKLGEKNEIKIIRM